MFVIFQFRPRISVILKINNENSKRFSSVGKLFFFISAREKYYIVYYGEILRLYSVAWCMCCRAFVVEQGSNIEHRLVGIDSVGTYNTQSTDTTTQNERIMALDFVNKLHILVCALFIPVHCFLLCLVFLYVLY